MVRYGRRNKRTRNRVFCTIKKKKMKLKVEVGRTHVTICNEEGYEVVHWVDTEWMEDPELVVPAIANAIRMAYVNPEILVAMNRRHIESQMEEPKEPTIDKFPAL